MTTFATAQIEAEWVEVLDGADYSAALVQLRGSAPAHIYVGTTNPNAAATSDYLTISHAVFPGLALSPLATEKVWARAATSLKTAVEGDRTAR